MSKTKIRLSKKSVRLILVALLLGSAFIASAAELEPPRVTTSSATDRGFNSVVVQGRIRPGGIAPTVYWVEWGVTQALGRATVRTSEPRIDSFNFQYTLEGLNPETRYYYRVVAENQFGRNAGNVNSFLTRKFGDKYVPYNRKAQCRDDFDNDGDGLIDLRDPGCENSNDDSEQTNFGFVSPNPTPPSPVTTTKPATVLNASTAVLNGQASLTTSTGTDVWFEWGTSVTELSDNITRKQNNGFLPNFDFSDTLIALKPNTIYYYRAVASNIYGISKGEIRTFSTEVFIAPVPFLGTISTPPKTTSKPQIDTAVKIPTPTIPPITADKEDVTLIKQVVNLTNQNGTKAAVSASANDIIQFTLNVKNTGTLSLGDFVVRDSVPATLEFVSSSKGSLFNSSKGEITWIISNLGPNESVQVAFTVKVKESENNALLGTVATAIGNSFSQKSTEALVIVNASLLKNIAQTEEAKNVVGNSSAASVVGTVGSGILPSTVIGWILLAISILATLLLLRYVLKVFFTKKDKSENDNDEEEVLTLETTLITPPGH
jgi:uncharacterized repeat protein (TIGR01451 family)